MSEDTRSHYLPLPGYIALDLACDSLSKAFSEGIYLVGSCLKRRDYRDVDVRALVTLADFRGMFPQADPDKPMLHDARWTLVSLGISEYLARMSGLPVDFQIQEIHRANAEHAGMRSALGMWRFMR